MLSLSLWMHHGGPWTRLVICSLFWSSCGMTRYLHYPPECVSVSTSALFQGVPWYYWTSVICTGDHCLSWVRCQEVLHHWMPFGQDPLLTVWTPLPYMTWNNENPAIPLWSSPLCTSDRSFQTVLECMWYQFPKADRVPLACTDSWTLFFLYVSMQEGLDYYSSIPSWRSSGSPSYLDSSILPTLSSQRDLKNIRNLAVRILLQTQEEARSEAWSIHKGKDQRHCIREANIRI